MSNPIGLEISSRAMYATWAYHKPSRILFDAGEGFCAHMLSRMFAIDKVLFSHQDQDHLGGITSLIGLRAKTKGDTGKKLDLYYPADNFRFGLIKDYIAKSWTRLPYELTWHPIEPGHEIKIDGARSIKAFSMAHQRNATTLGYKLTESRSKLRPEFVGQDIAALLRGGKPKSEIHQTYVANTFCWCTDSCGLIPEDIEGADFAVFDGTFLSIDDRDENSHFCWREVFELAKAAKVKRFLLAHISTRYSAKQIFDAEQYFRGEYPEAVFEVCPREGVLEL